MANDLKLCPFCGSAAETWKDEDGVLFVAHSCPLAKSGNRLEAWNTRPIEDRLTQENADLKARVKRLETALKASAGLIEGEFCSHSDPHAEGNRNCWTEFIYKALHSPPMREGRD
jgi:hypothetical protein